MSSPSIAFTPVEIGVLITRLRSGGGGEALIGTGRTSTNGPLPSIGFPKPSKTLPKRLSPTNTLLPSLTSLTILPGAIPSFSP